MGSKRLHRRDGDLVCLGIVSEPNGVANLHRPVAEHEKRTELIIWMLALQHY